MRGKKIICNDVSMLCERDIWNDGMSEWWDNQAYHIKWSYVKS